VEEGAGEGVVVPGELYVLAEGGEAGWVGDGIDESVTLYIVSEAQTPEFVLCGHYHNMGKPYVRSQASCSFFLQPLVVAENRILAATGLCGRG
jgi:hypothetical protein